MLYTKHDVYVGGTLQLPSDHGHGKDRADARRNSTLVERLDYKAYGHPAGVFKLSNFYGDPDDIVPGVVSINVLCVPLEAKMTVESLRPVSSPRDCSRTPR